jgi:hypothetical protein
VEAEADVAKAEAALAVLEATTAIQMWLGELDAFLEAWTKHEETMMKMMSASEMPLAKQGKRKTKK